jgi:hypothetical protein
VGVRSDFAKVVELFNIADDDELLQAMKDANFFAIFVGIDQSGQSPAFLRPTSRTRSSILSVRVSSFKRRSQTPLLHAPIEK